MNIHLDKLPPQSGNREWVGVDLEIWALNKKTMHRPTSGRFASLQICPNDEDVYIITDAWLIPLALGRIQDAVWIFHNSKFDLTHLRRWDEVPQRKKLWDTMLIERIMYNGYYPKNSYSLDDLVRRYLDIYMDKSLQTSFEKDLGEMTQDQIEYAAKDALLGRKVALLQKKAIDRTDFMLWKDIEAPYVWTVMDFKGMPIDVEGWKQTAEENQQKKEASDNYFMKELNINPRSPGKTGAVAKYVEEIFGIQIGGNTGEVFANLKNSHAHHKELVDFCNRILENKQLSSWVSDYGDKFIDGYVEQDQVLGNVIHANFWTIGADTGRASASKPPIHGVADRTTLFGDKPPFRKHFRAPDGFVMIRSDYPSQEPRCIAYVSGDEKLQRLFWKGDDPYIELGKLRYNETIQKNDPRRTHMKAMFLGAGYGLTPKGMVKKYGMTYTEAKKVLDFMFTEFPDLGRYVDETNTKRPKFVRTIRGRKFWLNWYNEWHAANNFKNSPIQGSGADMLKISQVAVHRQLENCPIIMPHHDETLGIARINEAQDIADLIASEMITAGEEMTEGKLPFPVTPALVQNWGEDK